MQQFPHPKKDCIIISFMLKQYPAITSTWIESPKKGIAMLKLTEIIQ